MTGITPGIENVCHVDLCSDVVIFFIFINSFPYIVCLFEYQFWFLFLPPVKTTYNDLMLSHMQ